VFLGAAAELNWLVFWLAPVAAVPLIVYPYGKRFTNVPHALLALAQAIGPIGAWMAVTGKWSWDAVVLGLAVGIWIGGFDLIFALQDIETDREQGLGSVPARWGITVALNGARIAHVVVTALFVWFGLLTHAGVFWWLGVAVVACAFVYEHSLLSPNDLSRLNRAFFTVNGFVGIALFCFALADLAVRGISP
jgi:4-hydroxybenzoate polyprenyltransferase